MLQHPDKVLHNNSALLLVREKKVQCFFSGEIYGSKFRDLELHGFMINIPDITFPFPGTSNSHVASPYTFYFLFACESPLPFPLNVICMYVLRKDSLLYYVWPASAHGLVNMTRNIIIIIVKKHNKGTPRRGGKENEGKGKEKKGTLGT